MSEKNVSFRSERPYVNDLFLEDQVSLQFSLLYTLSPLHFIRVSGKQHKANH